MSPTAIARERRRLNGIIASKESHPVEREQAERDLVRLAEIEDPTCPHCTLRSSTHGGAQCAVVVTFQRRNGKGLFPTTTQAAELRMVMAEEDAAKERVARRKDLKNRQTSMF